MKWILLAVVLALCGCEAAVKYEVRSDKSNINPLDDHTELKFKVVELENSAGVRWSLVSIEIQGRQHFVLHHANGYNCESMQLLPATLQPEIP